MSIKKPSMIKPNIKKPVGPKKPTAAPIKPTIAEEIKEETIADVEEVVVETSVATNENEEVSVVEEEPEQKVQEESVDVIVEEKPKKKSAKKSKKDKNVQQNLEPSNDTHEHLPQMSLEASIDAMASTVNITTPDWEEAKQEIEDKLKALTIDPDMNPATMKHLIGDLDDLMTELRFRLVDIEGQVEFINAQVDYIRSTNSKGSNAEERKANAFLALINYRKNPDDEEVINLIQYQIFMNNKLNFLNKSIETVRDRRQLLITFNSCMKIESTF